MRPLLLKLNPNEYDVSIHAPGRGATGGLYRLTYSNACFNSRTREGCDCHTDTQSTGPCSFNSRTREGCDLFYFGRCASQLMFQFTHPGGVRHSPSFGPFKSLACFNSRTREGCDVQHLDRRYPGRVSIHAPGRGATLTLTITITMAQFQFTHPGGVRLQNQLISSQVQKFQFTHPGGVRPRWTRV